MGAEANVTGLERGDHVDHFIVVGELGRGGMGEVVLAYDPDLDRKVALKLLRADIAGGAGERGTARLFREAQAMARLTHPNVATVYEVGLVDDRVYIAMELVDGVALGGWLTDGERATDEIVAVLIDAGRGLAAAHRANLVHRDVKPGNLMVGADGRGRVVDFGLARALEEPDGGDELSELPDSAETPLARDLTQRGAIVGTPKYMSPEQLCGEVVDARSDQFSFCVTAWEALFDARPYPGDQAAELAAAIEANKIAEPTSSRAVPARIRAALLRGLASNPSERFDSMESLIAELSPRSRRWPAVVGALAVAAMIAVTVVIARSDRDRCTGGDERLAGVWDTGRKAAIRDAFIATGRGQAEAAYTLVEASVDGYTRDWMAMRRASCEATFERGDQSDRLHDLRIACLDRRLGELGALTELFAATKESRVVDRASRAVTQLADLEICADARALDAAYPPPADAAIRRSIASTHGQLDRAQALLHAGRYKQAREAASGLVTEVKTINHPPLTAVLADIEAELSKRLDDPETAIKAFVKAARAAGRARDDRRLADSLISVVYIRGNIQERGAEAMELARVIEPFVERTGNQALRGKLLGNVGLALMAERKLGEALTTLRETAAIYREHLGPDHLRTATILNNIGVAHEELDQHQRALEHYEAALAIRERTLGRGHPDVAMTHMNIGIVLDSRSRYDDAVERYRHALEVLDGSMGTDNMRGAMVLNNLGAAYIALGRYAEALPALETAVAIRTRVLGPKHRLTIRTRENIGRVHAAEKRTDEALALFTETLAGHTETSGKDSEAVAWTLDQIGLLLRRKGDAAAALANHRRALGIYTAAGRTNHANAARSHYGIGVALLVLGKRAEAIRELEAALATQATSPSPARERAEMERALAAALGKSPPAER